VSDAAEMRCPVSRRQSVEQSPWTPGKLLFHRLAAETGKARLPTVVTLTDDTISCLELDDRSLDRDGVYVSDAGEVGDRYSGALPIMLY